MWEWPVFTFCSSLRLVALLLRVLPNASLLTHLLINNYLYSTAFTSLGFLHYYWECFASSTSLQNDRTESVAEMLISLIVVRMGKNSRGQPFWSVFHLINPGSSLSATLILFAFLSHCLVLSFLPDQLLCSPLYFLSAVLLAPARSGTCQTKKLCAPLVACMLWIGHPWSRIKHLPWLMGNLLIVKQVHRMWLIL